MRKLICLLALTGFVFAAQADEIELKIKGMTCPHGCVKRVDTALSKVPGVSKKKVTVGKAQVTFDAKKTKKEDLIAAIEKTGFKVEKGEKN